MFADEEIQQELRVRRRLESTESLNEEINVGGSGGRHKFGTCVTRHCRAAVVTVDPTAGLHEEYFNFFFRDTIPGIL